MASTFVRQKFDEVDHLDSWQSKKFYFKLTKMTRRWQCNEGPQVEVINCRAKVKVKDIDLYLLRNPGAQQSYIFTCGTQVF